jgi:hypothetical protein
VSDDPHEETSSIIPTYTLGHSEKTSARALFKVARKGKKKQKNKKSLFQLLQLLLLKLK